MTFIGNYDYKSVLDSYIKECSQFKGIGNRTSACEFTEWTWGTGKDLD